MRAETRRLARLASFAITLGLTGAAVQAQQPVVQPLLDSKGFVREEAYLPARLPESERAYARIDGRRMKDLVREVVAISRRSRDDGNRYWGRIAGTEYELMTADLIEARFKKLGLQDIHRQEFTLPPQWFATDWEVTAASGGKTYSFPSLTPALRSAPTPPGGLDAEAVWVGLGTAGDFAGRDVRGKAVIIHTMLAPGQMGQSAAIEGSIRRAAEHGAAAIFVIWGYYDNYAVWQALGAGPNNQPIQAPGFFLGFEDGKVLRDLVAAGPVRLTMRLDREMREGLKTLSVYGTLPGTTAENILVMAHMDGWFDAALDNASGISVMLSLVEHFAQVPRERRRRNIIFIGAAGHHVGSPNAAYLRDMRSDLLARTALMINCEHVSTTQTLNWGTDLRPSTDVSPRRWWVHGSRQLIDITLGAYRTFAVSVVGDMDPRATGEMGAIERHAPSIQLIRSPEIKHTNMDIPELVPASGLEAVARAFAKVIDEVNTLTLQQLQPAASPPSQSSTAGPPAPPGPLAATDVRSADIAAFISALPRDRISDLPIRAVDVGGYRVGIYGVFRPKSLAGDAILHETRTSEIYYMLKGAGTLATGGQLAGMKPGASPRAGRIEGGVSRRVSPGDVVIIPGRTPHWWSSLESDIEYLIFRPDPDGRMRLK